MKIEYRTGNLLTASEQVIIHGCNAVNATAPIRTGKPRLGSASEPIRHTAAAWAHAIAATPSPYQADVRLNGRSLS